MQLKFQLTSNNPLFDNGHHRIISNTDTADQRRQHAFNVLFKRNMSSDKIDFLILVLGFMKLNFNIYKQTPDKWFPGPIKIYPETFKINGLIWIIQNVPCYVETDIKKVTGQKLSS